MLAGVWLFLMGVFTLFPTMQGDATRVILGILALVAGVLVFIEYKD
jgi:uncharacterized membrane protein HdeD (DUF308 family)